MKVSTFSKIPLATRTRLSNYAASGYASDMEEAKTYWEDRITTACSVLYDVGCLNMQERAEVSKYYRTLVYFGGEVEG